MPHRTKNQHKPRHHIHANRPKAVLQLGRAVLRAAKLEATPPVAPPVTTTPPEGAPAPDATS